jgi:hypothetical protein
MYRFSCASSNAPLMPARLQPELITRFLALIGKRYPYPTRLYIFGGGAVVWLGSPRPTVDLDYTAEPRTESLRAVLAQTAVEMDVDLEEAIPADFVPLPDGAEARHQLIGTFGKIAVYPLDPYSQAIMKIARALETDMEDVAFLVHNRHIELETLGRCIQEVSLRYDEPITLQRNFDEFKRNLIK